MDADVRLRATNADSERDVFVGVARQVDVDEYLAGVAHDEVVDMSDPFTPVLQDRSGRSQVAPPASVGIWEVSATGSGTQQLDWEATRGQWAVVVMNADGRSGISTDLNIGAKAAFVLPTALLLLGIGSVFTVGAVALIVTGARSANDEIDLRTGDGATPWGDSQQPPSTVCLTARLDPELSRWMWLFKWVLAIPHVVVLAFLWVAFAVLTFVAFVSIVFTGRYPREIFDFNVGVMRWSWRVSYYAASGGLGTDRYPPFSLRPEPGDAATLDVRYPERLSRGLVWVKWFLAIPHLIVIALLMGGGIRWTSTNGVRFTSDAFDNAGGILGLLTLFAAIILLATDRYPRNLFDLIVGFNRWIFRTLAYVALMTDEYPPFRLDQGGDEPSAPHSPRGGPGPSTDEVEANPAHHHVGIADRE